VEDSGGGISDEVRRRMFQPFASTGSEGRGLGLALVLSIMRRTGGVVSVRTEPGLGTWFELLWPSAATVEVSSAPEAREGRLVLVVDDHAGVRSTACEMIRSLGYITEEARSGEEGLEKIAARTPDAVLLDVSLPGISGWEVLERIRDVAPGTRVILSSGHDVSRGTSRVRPDAFVPKPYMFDALQGVLEDLVPIGEVER
jgi:CheY-like chemotaxis protein